MKRLLLLFLSIFINTISYGGAGKVEFYNNTSEMVLKINTNSDKTRGLEFKKKGGSWIGNDRYNKKRTLNPGDAWKVESIGTGGTPDIRPTVKVYWKDPSKAFSYRGSYTRNKDINVRNDKTTRVYYRYRKDAAVPLERKIMFQGDGNPVESYGKKRGIGTVKFHNRTGHKIIVKYKVKNSNNRWRERVLPKDTTRVYPTGNKDNDIKDMEVRYHKDDKPTNISGEPDERGWSRDVAIKEGERTDIYITINNSKNFRRKVENGNIEEGKSLLNEGYNFIEFYNNTKEMVLEINTNSSKTKKSKFKRSGDSWRKDDYGRERTLKPGDAWSVKVSGTGGVTDIRPTVKVYWKDPNRAYSYRGSYTRNNKINVKNGETTRVYYRYRKDAAVPLVRKITLKGDIIENYGKKRGIGTVKFHNRTGHKIIVKYKVENSNNRWRERVLPKGTTRVYPTGNKDNDIKDMKVEYHRDDIPADDWIYSTDLSDRRSFPKNVSVKEGERTDIFITKNSNNLFRRKVEGKNIEKGDGPLKSTVFVNDTNIDLRLYFDDNIMNKVKAFSGTVWDKFWRNDSDLLINKKSVFSTNKAHKKANASSTSLMSVFSTNKAYKKANASSTSLMSVFSTNKAYKKANTSSTSPKQEFSSGDIKGLIIINHIKNDKFYIAFVNDFPVYKTKKFKTFLRTTPSIQVDHNKTTMVKIFRDNDGYIKVYVTKPF